MAKPLAVIYEDAEIIVLLKPSGVLSEESDTAPSLPRLLREGRGDIYPVHRLDKETAGLMVYAKTAPAAATLSAAFAAHKTEKSYYAVTASPMTPPSGELCDLLYRDRQRGRSYVVKRPRAGVKEARLSYTAVAEKDGLCLYRIRLQTGRTHQIRVQLASRGCPLLGDLRYGGRRGTPLALFATELSFKHPKSGEALFFSARPDEGHAAFSPFFAANVN